MNIEPIVDASPPKFPLQLIMKNFGLASSALALASYSLSFIKNKSFFVATSNSS